MPEEGREVCHTWKQGSGVCHAGEPGEVRGLRDGSVSCREARRGGKYVKQETRWGNMSCRRGGGGDCIKHHCSIIVPISL